MRSFGKNRTDRNGLKQGYWEYYYENGNILSKGSYKDDKAEGMWEYYYTDGSLYNKKLFENGYFIKWL